MFLVALVGWASALTASTGRVNPWQTTTQREEWYDRGKAYWEWADTTNDGVMSGIGPLHDADVSDSLRFLTAGKTPLWPSTDLRADTRALDIGAGIGRVSGALLLGLCGEVDLVDGSAQHLERARASLLEAPTAAARGRAGKFICSDLQSFVPQPSYDLIWIQWTTMYLTDEDLCRLLRDCKRALSPDGLVVLKDNVIDVASVPAGITLVDGRYLVDEEDASVSRTRGHLLDLIEASGMQVLASATADLESEELSTCLSKNGWEQMHPVDMIAMR